MKKTAEQRMEEYIKYFEKPEWFMRLPKPAGVFVSYDEERDICYAVNDLFRSCVPGNHKILVPIDLSVGGLWLGQQENEIAIWTRFALEYAAKGTYVLFYLRNLDGLSKANFSQMVHFFDNLSAAPRGGFWRKKALKILFTKTFLLRGARRLVNFIYDRYRLHDPFFHIILIATAKKGSPVESAFIRPGRLDIIDVTKS